MRSHLLRADDRTPQTDCHTADLWLIGPNAADWPPASSYRLPLDYAVSLPDGMYLEEVATRARAYRDGPWGGSSERATRPFVIESGSLRAITFQAYRDHVDPRSPSGAREPVLDRPAPPPSPCSGSWPEDDAAPEEALSTLHFATGSELGSLQPFRWSAAELTLSYQARLSVDLAVLVRLELPAEPSPGETHFDLGQQQPGSGVFLAPLEPAGRNAFWSSQGGTATLRVLEDGALQLELSDVSFVNSDGALRPAESGSIAGAWFEAP